jgi:GT2 family glycosyltransferase
VRVRTDGKQFALGHERFRFRGVTYGTFGRREDGALFPDRQQVKRDFSAMHEAGFTVVRTYTCPPEDVVELAADWGLRLFAGVFWPDWRYLLGCSHRKRRQVVRRAEVEVRNVARRLAGSETVMALSIGNEVPADVLRWVGTREVASALDRLVDVVREEDAGQLVSYANYPTAEYLPLDSFDFLTFNVFLEREADFRRYLTRLQHLAGDRPLVLGEVGLHSGEGPDGERNQASVLDWQLYAALERGVAGACIFSWTDEWAVGDRRVEGWHFGLTREDRSPRPALGVARAWNDRAVADLDHSWPSVSVVVCAYNAAETLDECLRHTCALEYPGLEVIVVDDGSTDTTAEIAQCHAGVQLVRIPHGGLSTARNAGLRAARGDLVAYLDADAYPPPEWPWYLALGMDGPTVGGVGGPNLPPVGDPVGAQLVARAPGGPLHVLMADDRAEHVPGCNMAFWKPVLEEIGGFDPVYTAAGDDVDACWKVLDRGWEIGFHPAAMVWHHRRAGIGAYLRQQRGYGRAEALVAARHPDRFTGLGTARWRGRIYNSLVPPLGHQRVYRGLYGGAAYQSVYQGGGHVLDVGHQVGIPLAALLVLTAPLAAVSPLLVLPALLGLGGVTALGIVDAWRTRPPRHLRTPGIGFRARVAVLHLLQPVVRWWARLRLSGIARRRTPPAEPLPGPGRHLGRGVMLLPATLPRPQLAAAVVVGIRRAGLRVAPATGWEAYDARMIGSAVVAGELVTSAHPEGSVQVRVRRRLRVPGLLVTAGAVAALLVLAPPLAAVASVLALAEGARGMWRTGPLVRRIVRGASG